MTIKIDAFQTVSDAGPTRFALHSVEGFGKTTLAAFFPRPAFVAVEKGFPRDLPFRPAAFKPTTWEEVLDIVEALRRDQHDYQTIVFDTVDALEALIHAYLLRRDSDQKSELNKHGRKLESIEAYGYGKGYVAAQEEFVRLLAALDSLQEHRAMHVVMLAHSQVKTFKNPAGEDFDRWQPKMHERIARKFIEWPENVLFGYFEVLAKKDDPQDRKAKAVDALGEGRRMLGTSNTPMYDAKNRVRLPPRIELHDPRELIPYLLGEHISGAPSLSYDDAKEPTRQEPRPQRADDVPQQSRREVDTGARKFETDGAPVESKQPNKAQNAAILQLLEDCERHLGAAYRAKVDRWIAGADGDAKKLDATFKQATADILKAKERRQQAAS